VVTAAPVGDDVWAGSRRLLRRLRDLMKGGGSGQERLDKVVEIIAADIGADVCSLYVLGEKKILELFATRGLKPEAVHQTRLRVGEGLVGLIAKEARALALPDAQKHPNFAYRPETGEEIYRSFLGVPIQRNGETCGVLTVQHIREREYPDEALEALETVAMVIAEVLASNLRPVLGRSGGVVRDVRMPARLTGKVLNGGFGIGRIVPQRRGIVISRIVADDPDAELSRLGTAVQRMHAEIDQLVGQANDNSEQEHRDILEAYRMFAEDRGWLRRIEEAIRSGLTAEAAVQKIQNETTARMAQVKDSYLRARLTDLTDLANRLLVHLLGPNLAKAEETNEDVILIARDLGPAELLEYDRERLRGIVLEEGGPTSHVAIVAKALDVPVIGLCEGILAQSREGELAMVDGENGQVFLRPSDPVQASFRQSLAAYAQRQADYAAVRDLPSVTKDGQRVSLHINAGLLIDMAHLHDSGAEGVGLYRTEIPFMVRDALPTVQEQTEWYGEILAQAGDKPVVFRTLDIGGDKALPYWQGRPDTNPALGWRALRIGLDRPAILRLQLRALLRSSASRPLRIMFPMVSEVSEVQAARGLLEREIARQLALGNAVPPEIKVGVMLEVPALAWQLPELFTACDFVSVGSNDLLQFLFAADRGHHRLADRYDPLSPAVLRLLKSIAVAAKDANCTFSLCGEMASRPLEAMALIGCGYRTLSLSAQAVPRVKSMVRGLAAGPLEVRMEELLQARATSLRAELTEFAADNGVAL